jgi:DNA polymerase III epsilon subunit-like protein
MIYPHPLIALDTETGDTLPSRGALLSIAANLWLPDNNLVWGYSRYILPAEGKIIQPAAAAKNGYTPERWAELGAVPLQEAMEDFEVWLKSTYEAHPTARLLAHNAGFDKAFLEEAASMTGISLPIRHAWRCSMQLFGHLMDKGILPEGTLKLERLAELSGHKQHQIHTAHDDADLCYHGYIWLLKTEADHYAKKTTEN